MCDSMKLTLELILCVCGVCMYVCMGMRMCAQEEMCVHIIIMSEYKLKCMEMPGYTHNELTTCAQLNRHAQG